MKTDFKITHANLDDFASWYDTLDDVARENQFLAIDKAPPKEMSRQFLENNIQNNVPCFFAKSQDKVIGWIDGQIPFQTYKRHICSIGLGVHKEYRSLGIGKALMQKMIEECKKIQISRIELNVRVSNLNAIKLYESLGFVHEGIQKNSIKIDADYEDSYYMALLI